MNARWLARSAFALMLAAVAVLIGGAGLEKPANGGHRCHRCLPDSGGRVLVPGPSRGLRWLALGLVGPHADRRRSVRDQVTGGGHR
jgi:hypothetical protein